MMEEGHTVLWIAEQLHHFLADFCVLRIGPAFLYRVSAGTTKLEYEIPR